MIAKAIPTANIVAPTPKAAGATHSGMPRARARAAIAPAYLIMPAPTAATAPPTPRFDSPAAAIQALLARTCSHVRPKGSMWSTGAPPAYVYRVLDGGRQAGSGERNSVRWLL